MSDFIYKITLIGDGAVGKTSLINKFVKNSYSEAYIRSLGMRPSSKEVKIENNRINLIIWDIQGQKGYEHTHYHAFKNARGSLCVYDVTQPETFENLKDYWVPRFYEVSTKDNSKNPSVLILGNKSDLITPDQKQEEECKLDRLLDETNIVGFLTSAKTGENVEKAFTMLTEMIYKGIMPNINLSSLSCKTQETDDIKETLDKIMTIYMGHPGETTINHVISEQMKISSIDPEHPTIEQILEFTAGMEIILRHSDYFRANKQEIEKLTGKLKRKKMGI